jgi:hypothetical protein
VGLVVFRAPLAVFFANGLDAARGEPVGFAFAVFLGMDVPPVGPVGLERRTGTTGAGTVTLFPDRQSIAFAILRCSIPVGSFTFSKSKVTRSMVPVKGNRPRSS